MERRATSYHSQGLVRALAVLRHLGTTGRPLGLAELAATLSIPKPTLLRLLAVLEQEEFVYREGNPPVYTVGHAVLEISDVYRRHANTGEVAAPYLRRLADVTGQTANIGVLEGRWVLHLCVEEPGRPLRFRSESGSLDHTYCTGLGKMLLAALPVDRVGDHLPVEEPFQRFTERTLTNRADVDAELERIRERGYSVDDEERDTGVVCVSVAIPSSGLNVAVSVSGPSGELSAERRESYLPALREVAEQLGGNARFGASLRASGGPGVLEVSP